MKKLRLLTLLIVPVLVLVSCTEMPEPEVKAKFPQTTPITDQLTGFQNKADDLLGDAVNFAGSLDPVANEIGEWMELAGAAMDTASYYLNIAKEAEVSVSGETTVYKYPIFTWSASGGEQTRQVEYQVSTSTDKTVHEVSIDGTKIIEATLDNAELENGTLTLSFSGNLGSPDYTFEWTQHDAQNVSVKVDAKSGAKPTYVEILINADNTITLNAQESAKKVFSADANAEGLKGTYERYDASGNVTKSGTWDLLAEDLSVVTLSIIDLYNGPMSAIFDSLGAHAATDTAALLVWQHYGGTIFQMLGRYVPYYTPPPDATTSQEPIEGDRWSLVYYWDDLAYQVSATPGTYYHTVYMQNGEAWDTVCHAEDSRTMRSAEMFFINDTLDIWDWPSHFKLSPAQEGGPDELHAIQPISNANPPAWQDYILTFDPATLASSDYRQIFNNSFGAFIWRVGNWTSGCATGYWEVYAWPGPALVSTHEWPAK
jgi:hypothetical protein